MLWKYAIGPHSSGDQQVGTLVAVDVGPHGGRDHADVAQTGRELVGHVDEFSADVAVEETARCLRIFAGHDATADEEVGFAVAVEIGRGDRRGAFAVGRQRAFGREGEIAVAVVEIEPIVEQGIALRLFCTPPAAMRQVGMPVAVHVEEDGADVVGLGRVGPRLVGRRT